MSDLVFGLDTFSDVPEDDSGKPVSYAQAIRQVVDEAVLAEETGVDVIALGEHHRPEFAISTPETVLAGIATRTHRIRLASGVTVLSSDDPLPPAVDIASAVVPPGHGRPGLIMIGALIEYGRRRELQALVAPVVLLALAVFVAWGRFGPHSF
ncbi:LLM class flavin-dependent oxidoreductase [Streptomyces sp.]|uniref:LLM class flavin-dependent oxidoreductase n=1 Tax=Streptomyces sp. TaxID=1931 RepID=UPI0025CFDD9D|nr:LLM class flavin-dependent oxidoreductase [Streptomyces sp.]